MLKQTIQYTSPIDALIAVTKRLSTYENQQLMDSEEFFDQYSRGQLSDDAVFVDLEAQLSGQRFEFESAKYGIEHVLPENPGDAWQQFDDQQREASTYRLGNMTLLMAEANRDLGNSGYGQKRPVYQESSFAITRKLSEDFDTWTVEKIRTHQSWMAKQATGIWRISFLSPTP